MLKFKGVLLIAFVLLTHWAWSQSDLTVQGATPYLYLEHTVQPKETWYSIGRIYNVAPKEIAGLSSVTMDKLSIGQQLRVPLTAQNFSQDGQRKADEVFVPVYHIVAEKEWMYRIGQNYNKVPVETLEKWNSVTNGQLQAGMKLVVGYLKVKAAQSPLAASGMKKIAPAAAPPATTPVVAKNDKPAAEPQKEEPKKEDPKKEEPKKEEPKKEEPKKEEAKKEELKKEEPKDTKLNTPPPAETKTGGTSVSNGDEASYNGYKGGYFKSMYGGVGKSTAGNAGIFRSTSGWKDGKYYALMNNVAVGTIIKVTYTSTNKSVFAKVLGQLPDMKESTGLTIRLSDAAAAELGAEMGKFYVDVNY